MSPQIRDYPWQALERLSREAILTCRVARRALEGSVDFGQWARSVGDVLGAEVQGVVHGVELAEREPQRGVSVYFQTDPGQVRLGFSSTPELGSVLVSRLLGAPWRLTRADAPLDPVVRGALAALLIESARRVGSDSALSSIDAWSAPRLLVAELTLLIDGSPYAVMAWCEPPSAPTRLAGRSRRLDQLGWLPLSLQLVVGSSACTRETLALLEPGDAWIPGDPMWLEAGPHQVGHAGFGVLSGAGSDHGVKVDFMPGGGLRLSADVVALPLDLDSPPPNATHARDDATPTGERGSLVASAPRTPDGVRGVSSRPDGAAHSATMSSASGLAGLALDTPMTQDKPLSQTALDAPLVVRVELGSVSMSAGEWAALEAGDVIETCQRISEPVVLRCAGREVARGELVEVEGQVGVRITELVGGASASSREGTAT